MSKTTTKAHPGFVLFEGPSAIDGQPIVVIATMKTTNKKTGDMIQTWILRSDVSPTEAINSGADESICGDCPLRGIIAMIEKRQKNQRVKRMRANKLRGCYVTVRNAPRAIWYAWKRGRYAQYNPAKHAHLFEGRKLRLGSYGDPVAAPYAVWAPLVKLASKHTGYTHQWRQGRFWRFFQTLKQGENIPEGVVICPASPEGGERRQCETCLGCNGAGNSPQRVSFAIYAHGSKATLSSYHKVA